MSYRSNITAVLLALLAFSTNAALAQAVTVISGGGDASACSQAARMTALLMASRSDLDPCNRALEQVQLPRFDRAATFVNRGIVLAALGRYQDALNDYNAALELKPDLPQAYVGKGNLYFLAERYDEAIAAYTKALDLNLVEKHVAYYDLGMTYEKLNDTAAAERSYRAALESMPDWKLALDKLQRLQEKARQPTPPDNG